MTADRRPSSYNVIYRSRRHAGLLAQGDHVAAMRALRSGDFDLLVQCADDLAAEFQTLCALATPSCRVVQAPIDDAPLTRRMLRTATGAAAEAARAYKRGERVLVNCVAGRNRSGLVVGLALHLVSGCGGKVASDVVRGRRRAASGPALTNEHFAKFLRAIPAANADSQWPVACRGENTGIGASRRVGKFSPTG